MRKKKIENSDDIMSVREAAEFFDIKWSYVQAS